jgi:hypothetical protein
MDKTSLVARNVKAFVVSWLTASLLFPLLIQINQGDTSYLFGVVMMLLGIVVPHMSVPALLVVVLFNWIVLRNRRFFNHLLALLLLGGLLAGSTFCLVLLTFSRQDLVKLAIGTGYMALGGAIFGFYYYHWVTEKLPYKRST